MAPEAFPAQSTPEKRSRSVADAELYRHSLMVQRAIMEKLGNGDPEAGMLVWGAGEGDKRMSARFRTKLDADPDGSFTALVMAEDADAIIEALKGRD